MRERWRAPRRTTTTRARDPSSTPRKEARALPAATATTAHPHLPSAALAQTIHFVTCVVARRRHESRSQLRNGCRRRGERASDRRAVRVRAPLLKREDRALGLCSGLCGLFPSPAPRVCRFCVGSLVRRARWSAKVPPASRLWHHRWSGDVTAPCIPSAHLRERLGRRETSVLLREVEQDCAALEHLDLRQFQSAPAVAAPATVKYAFRAATALARTFIFKKATRRGRWRKQRGDDGRPTAA